MDLVALSIPLRVYVLSYNPQVVTEEKVQKKDRGTRAFRARSELFGGPIISHHFRGCLTMTNPSFGHLYLKMRK